METLKSLYLNLKPKALLIFEAGVVGLIIISGFKIYRNNIRRKQRLNYPKDIVILHQFPRGLRAPSISPFPLKLETWMRMADIKYQLSPKGKIPWITLNGQDISDSQLCIEYLMETYSKDLSNHLSSVERAIARAFLKLNEESARWTGVIFRFKYGTNKDVGLPKFIFYYVGSKMLKETVAQGYGRHSKEEVYKIAKDDLDALEIFIGNKKYLMGEKICNEDASIFGLLAQLVNHDSGPINKYFMTECKNLQRYYNTIKTEFWPDWKNEIREN